MALLLGKKQRGNVLETLERPVQSEIESVSTEYLANVAQLPVIVSADSIDWLRESRNQARQEGQETIEFNRVLRQAGEQTEVPRFVDPLSTAHQVLEHQEGSEQYNSCLEALRLDTHRLLSEAYRRLNWEWFPKSRQDYDSETGDFFSNNEINIGELTFNGLTPNGHSEEEERRVEEWVEEAGTYRKLGAFIAAEAVDVDLLPIDQQIDQPIDQDQSVINTTRISLCPDWAIEEYQSAPETTKSYGGYVPEKEKFMIRSLAFDSKTNSRYESQLAISGEYIDTETIATAISIFDETISSDSSKKEVNSSLLLTNSEVDEWDWIELLDELASQKHGVEIFMGEILPEGQEKDYQEAKRSSEDRYQALEDHAEQLTSDILMLAKIGVDSEVAGGIIEAKVKGLMVEDCSARPAMAREMFNEQTALGFQRALSLEQLGDITGANLLRIDVAEQAPAASFCGAGSCGLENVDKATLNSDSNLGDLIESGDIVLKDTERPCSCGKKGIIYVFNEKKVTKYCSECERQETKRG